MKKLFKLKRWVSIPDAATYLSSVLEEEVRESDVLLLALDGNLKLAVHLPNGANAKRLDRVNEEEVEYITLPTLDGTGTLTIPKNGPLFKDKDGTYQVSRDTVYSLDGDVWGLRMFGGARLDVEHRFHLLTGGPAITSVDLEGNVFVDDARGNIYQLQNLFGDKDNYPKDKLKKPYNHKDNYYPAGGLPEDSIFVVLTSELTRFEATLSETHNTHTKPLGTTERTTLLTIIAALVQELDLPISNPSKTSSLISDMTARISASVSQRAIEDHLKRIPDALERRAKS